MNRTISPPPLKRQRRSAALPSEDPVITFSELTRPSPGALRIFSWNVNGIAPFVQPYLQRTINSFFKSSPSSPTPVRRKAKKKTEGGDVTSNSDVDEENAELRKGHEDPMKEGEPCLRIILKRYGWPHVLFLQEVKIKPGDTRTMAAVTQAANDETGVRMGGPSGEGQSVVNEEALLRDGGPGYKVHFNLPADPYNAKGFGGKVYGVAAIIRKDFVAKYVQEIREVPWDREGRIQVIETKETDVPLGLLDSSPEDAPEQSQPLSTPKIDSAKHPAPSSPKHMKFAIINIYAVNGTSNPYHSTHTGAVVGTRHDRKLAVHTDLLREAQALEARGFHVIIAGDLNIARSELDGFPNLRTTPYQHVLNRKDFNEKFFTDRNFRVTPSPAAYSVKMKDRGEKRTEVIRGLNGLDPFRELHGNERRYSYHPRGKTWGSSCDRVDLIVASRSLAAYMTGAGICDSPRDRGPSDHCPIWVEIGIRRPGDTDCL